MHRSLMNLLLGVGLLAPASMVSADAGGAKGRKAQSAETRSDKRVSRRRALHTQVMQEVERSLPKGLRVASLQLPSSLERQATRRDVVALRWRRPPGPGRAVVQVILHKRSGRIKKGWARINIVRFEGVLVASVDLEAGAIVQAGQLELVERALDKGHELQFEPAYLVGSRVVMSVKAGEPILASDISMPIPIARGTPVRIMIRRGGVVVTSSGVLETKTNVGAETRVRVAGKLIAGKLVRSDLVEMAGSAR